MKIQELRNLIRTEVRKAINESSLKENTNSFANEFAISSDVIKYFKTKLLPAEQAFIGKPTGYGKDDITAIWSKPSALKIALAVAEKLKQNKIDSLDMLYKVNKLQYTGTETLQDFLSELLIKQDKDRYTSSTIVSITPTIEIETIKRQ